jgi:2-polyprenyl-3-methyl-5-hydroxy-6-metoxy-1,4-benzoquinol methylase
MPITKPFTSGYFIEHPGPSGLSEQRTQRWANELAFFEETETSFSVSRTPEGVIQRYQHPRGRTALEYAVRMAAPLPGKRVLDLACSFGASSTLLAILGATVTGVDLSPKLIHTAQKRALLDGVATNCQFICSPVEIIKFKPEQFDLIWCESSIHHVIPELVTLMNQLLTWTKPGGMIIVTEPINHSPWLRRLRFATSVKINGSSDERPLEKSETGFIKVSLADVSVRYFRLLSRIERVFL